MNGRPNHAEDFDLYALGSLEGQERAAFEAHVRGCPDCAQKLAEARGALAALSITTPAESPSPEVREKLMRRIQHSGAGKAAPMSPQAASAPRPALRHWWPAALAVAAVVLAVLTVILWQQNEELKTRLEALNAGLDQAKKDAAQARTVVEVETAADTIPVALNSAGDKPGRGLVRYNARQGIVLMNAVLPAPPAGKAYQLWLVPDSGSPISAGVFFPGPGGEIPLMMSHVPPGTVAKAFAVTVESGSGNPQPTGPKVLIGSTS
jgi:anti-sigma-K factor RskA